MTINVEDQSISKKIIVRVKDDYEKYTGLDYATVKSLFPPVEDDDEDRSEYTLEDC